MSIETQARGRVVVIEDYALGAETISLALTRAGYIVLASVASRSEFDVLVVRLDVAGAVPDVVVTDLELPDCAGAEIVQHLIHVRDQRWPDVRIVVHSRSDRSEQLLAAFDAGADAFCSKFDEGDLVRVVGRALGGHLEVSESLAGHLLGGRMPLTPRQRDVLGHVAEGYSNREIGERLGISEKTVENHLVTIREASPIDASPGSSVRVKLTNWWHGRATRA